MTVRLEGERESDLPRKTPRHPLSLPPKEDISCRNTQTKTPRRRNGRTADRIPPTTSFPVEALTSISICELNPRKKETPRASPGSLLCPGRSPGPTSRLPSRRIPSRNSCTYCTCCSRPALFRANIFQRKKGLPVFRSRERKPRRTENSAVHSFFRLANHINRRRGLGLTEHTHTHTHNLSSRKWHVPSNLQPGERVKRQQQQEQHTTPRPTTTNMTTTCTSIDGNGSCSKTIDF